MMNISTCSSGCGCVEGAASSSLTVSAAGLAVNLISTIERFVGGSDQNLGDIESQVAQQAQELLRQATEAARQKADAIPHRCPVCGQGLSRYRSDHARTFGTCFGSVSVRGTRGYCKRCHKWRCPVDTVLGLEDTAGFSPAVQAMAAILRAGGSLGVGAEWPDVGSSARQFKEHPRWS